MTKAFGSTEQAHNASVEERFNRRVERFGRISSLERAAAVHKMWQETTTVDDTEPTTQSVIESSTARAQNDHAAMQAELGRDDRDDACSTNPGFGLVYASFAMAHRADLNERLERRLERFGKAVPQSDDVFVDKYRPYGSRRGYCSGGNGEGERRYFQNAALLRGREAF